jgi:hypothetical protein
VAVEHMRNYRKEEWDREISALEYYDTVQDFDVIFVRKYFQELLLHQKKLRTWIYTN